MTTLTPDSIPQEALASDEALERYLEARFASGSTDQDADEEAQ